MPIPKIMHFTYKNEESLKDKRIKFFDTGNYITLEDCVNSFKQLNPSWRYVFYNDAQMDDFVKSYYPDVYETWNKQKVIEKVDLFRYMVLFKIGGVFLDTDCLCSRPLDDFLRIYPEAKLIAGKEFLHKSNWINYPPHIQLNLWSIFSTKENYHIRNILATALGNCLIDKNMPVIEKTSMAVFGDYIYKAVHSDSSVIIANESYLSLDGRYEYMQGECLGQDFLPNYIKHCYHSSWVDEEFEKYAKLMEYRDNLLKAPENTTFNFTFS